MANTLAQVQVLFDSTPATLTYVGPNQINVIAPYAIARKASVNIVVTNERDSVAPVTVQVAPVNPGGVHRGRIGQGCGRLCE